MGGCIPTVEEAWSIYAYVDGLKKEASTKSRLAKRSRPSTGELPPLPHPSPFTSRRAIADSHRRDSHLVNDGVEETPPSSRGSDTTLAGDSSELFVDLGDANVGFRHWHPVSVTAAGGSLAGRAGLGGVWE